jgi:hypothetical protein
MPSAGWSHSDDDNSFECFSGSIERDREVGPVRPRNSDMDRRVSSNSTTTTTTPLHKALCSSSPNVPATPVCQGVRTTPHRTFCGTPDRVLCTPKPSELLTQLKREIDNELDSITQEQQRAGQPCVTALLPGFFVGGFPTQDDVRRMFHEGVRTIVTVCGHNQQLRLPQELQDAIQCYAFDTHDADDYYILLHHYEEFAEMLDDAFERGGVMVHCMAGVNRSVTLCLAYLIQRQGLTPLQSVRLLRAKGRPIVLSNRSFRKQLVEFYLDCTAQPTHHH